MNKTEFKTLLRRIKNEGSYFALRVEMENYVKNGITAPMASIRTIQDMVKYFNKATIYAWHDGYGIKSCREAFNNVYD